MKRLFPLLTLCLLASSFSWAMPSQPSLTYVKARHHGVHHHAHKAVHHKAHRASHPRA
jgi:hypothetical protein